MKLVKFIEEPRQEEFDLQLDCLHYKIGMLKVSTEVLLKPQTMPHTLHHCESEFWRLGNLKKRREKVCARLVILDWLVLDVPGTGKHK